MLAFWYESDSLIFGQPDKGFGEFADLGMMLISGDMPEQADKAYLYELQVNVDDRRILDISLENLRDAIEQSSAAQMKWHFGAQGYELLRIQPYAAPQAQAILLTPERIYSCTRRYRDDIQPSEASP